MGKYAFITYMIIGFICMVIEMYRIDKMLPKTQSYDDRREQNSMYPIYMMMVLFFWPVWLDNMFMNRND